MIIYIINLLLLNTVLTALHTLIDITLIISLQNRHYYCPPLINEETEAWGEKINLPKIIQLVSGRAWIGSQEVWLKSPLYCTAFHVDLSDKIFCNQLKTSLKTVNNISKCSDMLTEKSKTQNSYIAQWSHNISLILF